MIHVRDRFKQDPLDMIKALRLAAPGIGLLEAKRIYEYVRDLPHTLKVSYPQNSFGQSRLNDVINPTKVAPHSLLSREEASAVYHFFSTGVIIEDTTSDQRIEELERTVRELRESNGQLRAALSEEQDLVQDLHAQLHASRMVNEDHAREVLQVRRELAAERLVSDNLRRENQRLLRAANRFAALVRSMICGMSESVLLAIDGARQDLGSSATAEQDLPF